MLYFLSLCLCSDVSLFVCLSFLFIRSFLLFFFFFFFNDTATTEIYTLSLHDALPISVPRHLFLPRVPLEEVYRDQAIPRSEEHTSELQSLAYLVCRLLLEKKKKQVHRQLCSPTDLAYHLLRGL